MVCCFFFLGPYKIISVILNEYTAADGDAAARFNLEIKITVFEMKLRVPWLFPHCLAENWDEPSVEISCTYRLGLFACWHGAVFQ